MATNTYKGPNSGVNFWDAPGNWSSNSVPISSDSVSIIQSGTYTVSIIATDVPYIIASLTIGPATLSMATLSIAGSLADQGTISLSNGVISVVNKGRLTVVGSVALGSAATLNINNIFTAGQITGGVGDAVNIAGGNVTIGTTTDSASYNFSSSGVLNITGTVSATDTFNFTDNTTDLLVLGSSSNQLDATITGFNSANAIDLTQLGYSFNYILASNGQGGTLIEDASKGNAVVYTFSKLAYTTGLHLVRDPNGATIVAPCFVAGTAIATPVGAAAVERLAPGDLVLTASGAAVPVKWVGRRKVDLARHANPELANPVRIHAGAVEAGVPSRDLLVSPDHAILMNGVLIPAALLVNDVTVTLVTNLASVEYIHVELDKHDILLAEGLAAESYLDTGNRATFSNAGIAVLLNPEFSVAAGARAWTTDACAPLAIDGPVVALAKQQLLDRAIALGLFETAVEPEIRLLVGSRTIRPMSSVGGTLRFAIPRGAKAVRLVSRSASPSDVTSTPNDRRVLGVAVGLIETFGPNGGRVLPIDHPELAQGWHAIEAGAASRWTNGDAMIEVGDGTTLVDIAVVATVPYRVDVAVPMRAAA